MKQETIDVLRMVYPPHLEDSKFMTFELRTETWADILAVLEAAYKYAEYKDDFLKGFPASAPARLYEAESALLALIDLETTE